MASKHPKVGSGAKSPGVRRGSLPETDKGALSGYMKRMDRKLTVPSGKMNAQAGALNKHADAMIASAKGKQMGLAGRKDASSAKKLFDDSGALKGTR